MDYSLYSLERKEHFQKIANKLKLLSGESTLTVEQFSTILLGLDPSYQYESSELPSVVPEIITDYNDLVFENKTYITNYANALRSRAPAIGNVSLTVAQMALMTEALNGTSASYPKTIEICQCFVINDYSYTFTGFELFDQDNSLGSLGTSGGRIGDIEVTNVNVYCDQIDVGYMYPDYYTFVKATIVIHEPTDAIERYILRLHAEVYYDWTDYIDVEFDIYGNLYTPNDPEYIQGSSKIYGYNYWGAGDGDITVSLINNAGETYSTTLYTSLSELETYNFTINSPQNKYVYNGSLQVIYNEDYYFYLTGTATGPKQERMQLKVSQPSMDREYSLNFTIGTNMPYVKPEVANKKYEYNVVDLDGGYGFALNEYGYYESNNQGMSSSYAISRVLLDVKETTDVVFTVINYAESNWDFGLIGALNSELIQSEDADWDAYQSFSGLSSPDPTDVIFYNVTPGKHFIEVKYRKDSSVDTNNDSMQFKVDGTFNASLNGGDNYVTVHVCREISPFSDYEQEIDYFDLNEIGTIPASGGTSGPITISNVESRNVWVPDSFYDSVAWFVVDFDVTVNAFEGGEPYYITVHTLASGMENYDSTSTCISSDGVLLTPNDDGEITITTATSDIYLTGYAGPTTSNVVIKLLSNNSVIAQSTLDLAGANDSATFNIGSSEEHISGTCKLINDGYYSEWGNESNWVYYITGTLTGSNGHEYVIQISSMYSDESHSVIAGADMEYIPEPEYKGDLSNPKQFNAWLGVNEGQSWASDGFYISVLDSNSLWRTTTSKIQGEGTYQVTGGGSVVITNMESRYDDAGWGTAETVLVDGTIYGYSTTTSIVLHATQNIEQDLINTNVQYATIK